MISLFQLSYPVLVFLIMILCINVILQTLCTVYGFFRFTYDSKNLVESLLSILILIHLFTLIVILATLIYNMICGFALENSFSTHRYLLFILMLTLCISIIIQSGQLISFSVVIVAAFTLPITETLTGKAFPLLFITAVIFWLFRSIDHILIYIKEKKENLSAFSIKEAVDTMDFGILFYKDKGNSEGQILLSNRKMLDMMQLMTGRILYNGKEFYQMLINGDILECCQKDVMNSLPFYTLPDQSVWRFDLSYIQINKIRCAVLMASDATLHSLATSHLVDQNAQLEERNRELKRMLKNIEQICRTEETIHAKGRVHDLLGQRISVLLRSVREHKEPDQFLLQSFANGLPEELKKTAQAPEYSLKNLSRNFQGLGVNVYTEGNLPKDPSLHKIFYEIAAEAMTNSVRHGYATEIYIKLNENNKCWELSVTDNGLPKEEPVVEGGGLKNMRRKVLRMNGKFHYTSSPHFTITVTIPKGGKTCTTY